MKVAAIIYDDGSSHRVDDLIRSIAHRLIESGARISGAVQINHHHGDESCAKMVLEELTSGRQFDISTCRVSGTKGCTLDAAALEDVAGLVSSTLPKAELLVINRFGKQEVSGEGFRGVIESAVANDIPVIVAVKSSLGANWATFAGDDVTTLEASREPIETWCHSVMTR